MPVLALGAFFLFTLVLAAFVALRTFLQWRALEEGSSDSHVLLKTAMLSTPVHSPPQSPPKTSPGNKAGIPAVPLSHARRAETESDESSEEVKESHSERPSEGDSKLDANALNELSKHESDVTAMGSTSVIATSSRAEDVSAHSQ